MDLKQKITHVGVALDCDHVDADELAGTPAVEQARRLARRLDCSLTLVAFLPELKVGLLEKVGVDKAREEGARSARWERLHRVRSVLFELCRDIQLGDGATVRCEVLEERLSTDALADWAEQVPVDLLILENPSSDTTPSIIDRYTPLIRRLPAAVWFTGEGSRPQSGIVAALSGELGEDEPVRMLDHDVVDLARGFGRLFDADLHFVKARPREEPILTGMALTGLGIGGPAAAGTRHMVPMDRRGDADRRAVQAFVNRVSKGEEEKILVLNGEVPEVISGAAGAVDAGLIVMGAREKSRWELMLFGGAVESTLALAPCDVLLVKQTELQESMTEILPLPAAGEAVRESEWDQVAAQPRYHFRSPAALVEHGQLSRRDRISILRSWEKELANEVIQDVRLPQQRYEKPKHASELKEVRKALAAFGEPPREAERRAA
jgi:nucleotide-binding universal stress UspA family protein